jgi:ribose transport system permease protein
MKQASFLRRTARSKYVALLAVTVVLAAVFTIIKPDYIGVDNIKNIMVAMSFTGTLAVGMTMLLIAGEVDLAAGVEACLSGVICAILIESGLAWPIAIIVTIAFGAFCGLINVFFVNVLNLMGFIATIGIMSVFTGIIRILTSSKSMPVSDKTFWAIGSTKLFGIIPLPFLIMVVLMLIYGFVLNYTSFGRNVYLIGGNRRAARLCGVNQKKVVAILYINNGALAAVAGIVLAARMHSASPMAGSTGALDAITVAVLGGVAFIGGIGKLGGVFIGLLLLTVFNVGLTATGFQSYWQIIAQGALLILALSVDFFSENSRRKALEREEAAVNSNS